LKRTQRFQVSTSSLFTSTLTSQTRATAWLVAAVLDATHPLQSHVECNLRLETALSILPKQLRINKSETQYRKHILALTEN